MPPFLVSAEGGFDEAGGWVLACGIHREVTVLGMGCCLVAGVAAASPRIILFGMWLFTDYLGRAYDTWVWPLLGFFLLPTTTIAYSIAANEFGGFRGWGAVIVAVGVIIDVVIYSGNSRSRRSG